MVMKLVEVAWVFPGPEEVLSDVFDVEVRRRPTFHLVSVLQCGSGYGLVFVHREWS